MVDGIRRIWRTRRARWIGAGLVGILLLGGAGVRALTAHADERPAAPVTAAADRGPVTLDVATSGTVQPATTRSLSFTVDGTVTKVSVRPGSKVTAGQVLAAVDDTVAAEAVDEAQDSLNQAEAQLTAARAAAEAAARAPAGASSCPTRAAGANVAASYRGGSAYLDVSDQEGPTYPDGPSYPEVSPHPSGSSSPPAPAPTRTSPAPPRTPGPTRPTASPAAPGGNPPGRRPAAPSTAAGCPTRTGAPAATTPGGGNGNGGNGNGGNGGGDQVLGAQQRVNQADATLEQAEDALQGATITAPIAGTVLSVAGKVGSQVGRGSAFVTVADTFAMQVTADFPEADAGALAVRQQATVTLADGGGRELPGTVARVDPVGTTDATMVRYGVVVSFTKAPGDLLVGQSAAVKVRTGDVADALRVPSTAVHDVVGGSGTVLVRAGTTSTARKVGVGLRGDQYTQITSGLDVGAVVVRSW